MKKTIRSYQHLLITFFKGIPRYFKYQIVTQLLLSMLVLPLFWCAAQFLMSSWGIGAVSNSILMKFLFSPQGAVFLLLAMALVMLGLLIEFCGFIAISAQVCHDQGESSYWELLKFNLRQLPRAIEFGGLMLLIYVVVMLPLTESGPGISFLKWVKVPAFVTSVIEGSALYMGIYLLILLIMLIFSVRWLFTFHFMVVADMRPSKAMKASGGLIRRHLKFFIKRTISFMLFNALLFGGLAGLWALFIVLIGDHVALTGSTSRILMVFLLLIQEMVAGLVAMMVLPFEVHYLTLLFYELVEHDSVHSMLKDRFPTLPVKVKKSLLDRILAKKRMLGLLVLGAILSVSIPAGMFLDELLETKTSIAIMAHRGGGFEGPENTLAAIRRSVENGAQWVEIDVQRTRDGVYVLNHDVTLGRVTGGAAGTERPLSEMTWAEIQKLDVGVLKGVSYKGERVSTLDEVLDYCKDRIKVNIELKGKTADSRMMEDVVALVYSKGMTHQVMLTSLDLKMIELIEKKYPTFDTGFIFFLAFGKVGDIRADYLILEEGEATEGLVEEIHNAGKKAVVWTVDTPEAMERFAHSDVDAVITDDVKGMHAVLKRLQRSSVKERLLELFVLEEEK